MIKIGIVGSGFGRYGLLPAFSSIKNCKIFAICGKKTRQLTNSCRRIGIKHIYSDWRLMLKNKELNAVAIAVTPRAQYMIAKTAINNGLHIFAEKPLAANTKQAKELFILAKKNKITHAVDFIFPEITEWQATKKLIDSKKFGALKHISVNWDFISYDIKNKKSTWKTSIADGGGALSYYFSHGLYYLEYFAGEIIDVKSLFTYAPESLNGAEVGVDILLRFKGGTTGYAHVCCNNKRFTRHQLIFKCENGVIILENKDSIVNNFTLKTYSQNGIKQLAVKKNTGRRKDDARVKIVKKIAGRFINSCIQKRQMLPSFKEGLRVQKLIETIRAMKM